MKITKAHGIKILKLVSMEDVICDMFEGEDANGNSVVFGKNVFAVNVITGRSAETSLMSVTPWIPFTADEYIPIYYDTLITVVNPMQSFKDYYINVQKKWSNADDEIDFKSSSEKLDEMSEPSDEELEMLEELEALAEMKDKTFH